MMANVASEDKMVCAPAGGCFVQEVIHASRSVLGMKRFIIFHTRVRKELTQNPRTEGVASNRMPVDRTDKCDMCHSCVMTLG